MDSKRIAAKKQQIAECKAAIAHNERVIKQATASLKQLKTQSKAFWGDTYTARQSEFEAASNRAAKANEKHTARIAKLEAQLAPFVEKAGA